MAATRELESLFVRFTADATQFFSTTARVEKTFVGLTSTIRQFATLVATSLGGKIFAQFDDALTRTLARMGDFKSSMRDAFTKDIFNLSSNSTFNSTEIAKALGAVHASGITAAYSMEVLGRAEKFALAGGMDLMTATRQLTDIQNNLGLSSNNASVHMANLTHITDLLLKATTVADTTAQEMAAGLNSRYIGALNAAHYSLEEGVAILGMYAAAQVKGSDAGERAFRLITILQDSMINHLPVWEKLQMNIYNLATGGLKPMNEILGELDKRLSKLTPQAKKDLLAALGFNQRYGLSQILPILNKTDVGADIRKALGQAGGTTKTMSDMIRGDFLTNIKAAIHELQNLAITVGTFLAPGLLFITTGIKNLTQWFQNLHPVTKGVLLTFVLLVPTLRLVATILRVSFGTALGPIGRILELITLLYGFIKLLSQMEGPVGDFFRDVLGFFENFGENMKRIMEWLRVNWTNLWKEMGRVVNETLQEAVTGLNLFGSAGINSPAALERVTKLTKTIEAGIQRQLVAAPGVSRNTVLNAIGSMIMGPNNETKRRFFARFGAGTATDLNLAPAELQAVMMNLRGGIGTAQVGPQNIRTRSLLTPFPQLLTQQSMTMTPDRIAQMVGLGAVQAMLGFHGPGGVLSRRVNPAIPEGEGPTEILGQKRPSFEFKQISLARMIIGGPVNQMMDRQQFLLESVVGKRLDTIARLLRENKTQPTIPGLHKETPQETADRIGQLLIGF